MIALCTIRKEPHYRREAFEKGLRAAGYSLVETGKPTSKDDVLVTWNRYGAVAGMADTWERSGGTVLVCENGYLGNDVMGRQLYAIAVHGHNGSGWFPVDARPRLSLSIRCSMKEWQTGTHILVCGQRGIGSTTMASPDSWHTHMANQLRKLTDRPVRVRAHPGNAAPTTTLEADLAGAHACVIWSSASGVQSLVSGVPVFYSAPHWICEDAALHDVAEIENPLRDDDRRICALQRMAYAQWGIDEIERGLPFALIRDNLVSASWQ